MTNKNKELARKFLRENKLIENTMLMINHVTD